MAHYSPFLHFIYEGMMTYESIVGTQTVGAQTIVRKKNAVLLIKPTYRPTWEFPGGKVEKGEAPETAAVRETKEEARVFVKKIERKLGTYTDHRVKRVVTIHVYVAGEWEELDLWRPSLEIADRGFFALNDLPQDISPATLRRIEELLRPGEKEFSGTWR